MRSQRLLSALVLGGLLACSRPPAQESHAAPPATSSPAAPEAIAAGEEAGAASPQQAVSDPDAQLLAEAAQIAAQAKAETEEDAKDRERQRQTVAEVRSLGVAIFGWLDDAVNRGGPAHLLPHKTTVDVADYQVLSHAQLETLLVPRYLRGLPAEDGWGHPYEVRINVNDVFASRVFFIRSPGRDGEYSTDSYTPGPFDQKDYDQDIVFADDFMVRWPRI
jgi:hypothetical protein